MSVIDSALEVQSAEEEFRRRTKSSLRLHEAARAVMPGGVSANLRYYPPYPLAMLRGEGSRLWDVDGNEYLDYQLTYGALLLGHGAAAIRRAVEEQIRTDGTVSFGAPHARELGLCSEIQDHYAPEGLVRLTNSGLEATLLCLRLATAWTGRSAIAKFEGHYHGAHDRVLVSYKPRLDSAGPADAPEAFADSLGISREILSTTVVLPFNDWNGTERLLRLHAKELAAVIAEPIQGGYIAPRDDFLQRLRKLTTELGICLIFDEVKTGFRFGLGGAQRLFDVRPDLTALGKILGGGYPIGAVVGSASILGLLDPSAHEHGSAVFHSGTYNGHPAVSAAAISTIDELKRTDPYERMAKLTDDLKERVMHAAKRERQDIRTPGVGSVFSVVFTNRDVRSYREVAASDLRRRRLLDLRLMTRGVYFIPGDRFSLSTVHTSEDIRATAAAFEASLGSRN